MKTASKVYKGYEIRVVYNPPVFQANIYPLNKSAAPLNHALPPIRRETEKEAFEQACRRIDQHT
jgi:hypothetical protein